MMTRILKVGALASAMVLALACGDDDETTSSGGTTTSTASGSGGGSSSSSSNTGTGGATTSSSSTGGGGVGGGAGGGTACDVPMNAADLETFISGGTYQSWDGESAVHPSTGPHGMVRTYVNQTLFDSLTANNASHPVCSAAIKELYENDGTTISGYAVTVKATNGTSGGDWYWYERIGNNVVADGTGVGGCTGCHGSGTDYFRSPFPLQ